MDSINTKLLRQLIRLLERIENRDPISISVHKQAEAIHEQSESTKSYAQPQPPVLIHSTLELPIEVREYYKSQTSETPRGKIWRRTRNTFEIGSVLVAVMLAFLTCVPSPRLRARQIALVIRSTSCKDNWRSVNGHGSRSKRALSDLSGAISPTKDAI